MGLGDLATSGSRLTDLSLPRAGIDELAMAWSGDGSLFDALAASEDETSWSARDIKKRAERILLGKVQAHLDHWPQSVQRWQEFLPVTVVP